MEVETERPGYRARTNGTPRRPDDRHYPGPDVWHEGGGMDFIDVTRDLMGGEVIGGACRLFFRFTGKNGEVQEARHDFTIRGLNPADAVARAFIGNNVEPRFSPFAWAVARKESKQTTRDGRSTYVFNQFNPFGEQYKGLPNKTTDITDKNGNVIEKRWGWGMCQIDRGPFTNNVTAYVCSTNLFNWRTNVHTMAKVLLEKEAVVDRFEGYFKLTCDNTNAWRALSTATYTNSVPGTNNVVFSGRNFGTITLYNGSKRCPEIQVVTEVDKNGNPTKKTKIQTPIQFDSATRRWLFHHNDKGYADLIAKEMRDTTKPKE
jgi:hypothetical protein